jgi:hypothetical protein
MPVTSGVRLCRRHDPCAAVSERDADPRVRVPLRDEKRSLDGAALAARRRHSCQFAAWHRHICQASRLQRPEHSCTA